MLGLQYDPSYGIADSESWPYSKYVSIDVPDYRITKPLDYYDKWPAYYYMYLPIPEYRRYLNNLLLRDLRNMVYFENRWDPILGYDYTYFPDSKYFKNYRFSPPINWLDDWSYRSRVWFPYYWSTRRLFNHYMDYRPSYRSMREQRRTVYLDYPYPIKAIDYPYYPYSYRTYRPLSLYYDYYYPLSSLNHYYWPYYPYYRYLYYKYTLPSDRYYYLKGKMLYIREPINGLLEYRLYPTPRYLRHKIYKPLSLYTDYYYPIRSLYWNSSYWPLYRSVSDFRNDLPSQKGLRLQKIFDNETSLIRAQTNSLLRRIHDPVPRVPRYSWPLSVTSKYYDDSLPARLSNDNYIHKLLITSSTNPRSSYTTYYTEPIRKYIGDRAYSRRPHIYLYEDPLKSDIQLLSYYINKFKRDKAIADSESAAPVKVPLSSSRPSRRFAGAPKVVDEAAEKEMQQFREARAARLAFIQEETKTTTKPSSDVEDAVKAKKKQEEERLAEEKALAEEQARKDAQARKEEAARKAELARQEELAAQAAAERAAELERQAELLRQEELAKQADIERARQQEEERLRQEEQRRLEEEAKAEEERQQLLRLEELARQAEEEKEAELARQAEELAELARQEAELAEEAKKQAELDELARQEAELAELERQEAELAELERKEKELAELARQEAEEAERARQEAEAARKEAELAELARAEAELAELERQQAELDALEAEAKALEADVPAEDDAPPPLDPPVDDEEEVLPEESQAEDEDEDLRKQREMDELIQRKFELAELERQQAELDALEAEAKALAGDDVDDAAQDDEDEPAIAEDVPGVQSDAEEQDEL